jgi:hypothetical protein
MADSEYRSERQAIQVRTKACEFAAQMMEGEGMSGDIASRLMSLCVFFEMYIISGSAETEKCMRILSKRKTKKFRVIAGGNLS